MAYKKMKDSARQNIQKKHFKTIPLKKHSKSCNSLRI